MVTSAESPLSIGRVVLTVHDLDAVSRYYEEVIGLRRLSADAMSVLLGAGSRPLLELRRDPAARERQAHEAGLFHAAFLLPSRNDLARWMTHIAARGIALDGASDHVVSEAIYLSDPEGNGIEVYADRPSSDWPWADGLVVMRSDPLDLKALMSSARGPAWREVPDQTVVGHIHLQVGDLKAAEAFYAAALGLDVTCRYRGATFFSSGGYHHHVATNIWRSSGASVRPEPAIGLAEFEIAAADAGVRDAVRSKLAAAGVAIADSNGGFSVRDPWGTAVAVVDRSP